MEMLGLATKAIIGLAGLIAGTDLITEFSGAEPRQVFNTLLNAVALLVIAVIYSYVKKLLENENTRDQTRQAILEQLEEMKGEMKTQTEKETQ